MQFKSLLISGLCLFGFAMTACDDQDDASYTPADPSESPEAYFSPTTATSAELVDGDTQFTIPVYRPTTAGSLTVPVACTASDATPFTIPSSVTFVDGSDVANFVVAVDAEKLMAGVNYTFDLTIGDGLPTPYCVKKLTYTVNYSTWEDVLGPNGEAMGTWVEDLITGFYKLSPNPNPEWAIQIQKSPAIEGLYRVVNPYKNFNINASATDYSTDHYLYFNASNPDGVFLCTANGSVLEPDGSYPIFTSGLDLGGDGWFQLVGYYNYGVSIGEADAAAAYLGTFKNGVVKFPKQGIVIAESNYQGGAAAQTFGVGNKDEKFRIIFPGATDDTPVEAEWESIGEAQFTDAWITPFYRLNNTTWTVAVERKIDTPTLFRLVNPYKSGVMIIDGTPLGESGMVDVGADYEGDVYLQFDCSDPSCVLVPQIHTGYADDENGEFVILNAAYLYYAGKGVSLEDIVNNGYGDPYDESTFTVTIGANHAWFNLPDSPDEELAVYYNAFDQEGKIVMTDAAAATAKLGIASTRNYERIFANLLARHGLVTNHKKLRGTSNKAIKKSLVK